MKSVGDKGDVGEGWTLHSLGIVARACDHHGGMERWRSLRLVRLVPREPLAGLLPWLKGFGATFPMPASFEIEPHARLTRLMEYPSAGLVGVYRDGHVSIVREIDGAVLESSAEHRATFVGLARLRRWSPLDALYFFGYALAHYHALPFTLTDARLIQSRSGRLGNDAVDIIDVEFPESLHTHSRRQRFFFAASGRLLRHDYVAEVIGAWARGAHYWNEPVMVSGVSIALERLVRPRIGMRSFPFVALRARFASADVELNTHAADVAR
jgi:hypothetical protein